MKLSFWRISRLSRDATTTSGPTGGATSSAKISWKSGLSNWPLYVSVLKLKYVGYWPSLGPLLIQWAQSQHPIGPTQIHWSHWHSLCPLACPVACHPSLDAPGLHGPSCPVVNQPLGSFLTPWTKCQPLRSFSPWYRYPLWILSASSPGIAFGP